MISLQELRTERRIHQSSLKHRTVNKTLMKIKRMEAHLTLETKMKKLKMEMRKTRTEMERLQKHLLLQLSL